ncbi:MAG TPA: hypothetical protein VG452_08495 [Egibacteraceae bacterium]|nr:hypothetical protein [Actinomycetota bacterium]HWB72244.1 hypothetical protein [Egibacteraceae bacterium]
MDKLLQSDATPAAAVCVAEARAWSDYVRRLRAEIAERKAAGLLPSDLGAPTPMFDTLLVVLAAVDALPWDQARSVLALPEPRRLHVWAWYQSAAQNWADELVADGVLSVRRSAEADRFWAQVERLAQVPGHQP